MAEKFDKATEAKIEGHFNKATEHLQAVARKPKQDLSFLSESQRFQIKQCLSARGACDQAAKIIKRGGKLTPDVLQACSIISGAVGQQLASS